MSEDKKQIRIAMNATTAKLLDADRTARTLVSECLSYYVMGYENTYSFKNKTWDGRSSMFDWNSNTFSSGFLRAVGAHLKANGYKVALIRKPLPKPLGIVPEKLGGFSYTDRYDYQWQTTEELCKRGMMIARLATGAGKTFAAGLAYARIARPTLILTKRQPLMHQFAERMKDFGFDSGLIGDQQFDINPNLTVAMSQTLSGMLNDTRVIEYLKTVEFIIGEEVHEISDERYWKILQACPNAYYKLGLTATPFMKDKSESNMKLLGAFGPIGMVVSEKTLIDRGINAKPYFKIARYTSNEKLKFGSNYQKAVNLGIVGCEGRNKVIVQHALEAKKRKLPVLILVGRKEHGQVLVDLLKDAGLSSKFIFGDTKAIRRQEALIELAKQEIDVLIGSTIVDVGIDVPSIGLVIMAGGGKAEVQYRQRIGRGLREKRVGPNVCYILDFDDGHNIHLNEHATERRRMIQQTPGFAENLLPLGENFPW